MVKLPAMVRSLLLAAVVFSIMPSVAVAAGSRWTKMLSL
jgi:hypothetical protein